jgi:hypothetical protein
MSKNGTERSGGFRIELSDVRGFPDSIANDLDHADGKHADAVAIEYDEERQKTVVQANHDNAAKWLYDWLEDTAQYYRENYVDASGDHDAARDLADVVYEEVSR